MKKMKLKQTWLFSSVPLHWTTAGERHRLQRSSGCGGELLGVWGACWWLFLFTCVPVVISVPWFLPLGLSGSLCFCLLCSCICSVYPEYRSEVLLLAYFFWLFFFLMRLGFSPSVPSLTWRCAARQRLVSTHLCDSFIKTSLLEFIFRLITWCVISLALIPRWCLVLF